MCIRDSSNDVYFTLTALGAAERVAAVREDLVYYRVNYGGSLQNRKDVYKRQAGTIGRNCTIQTPSGVWKNSAGNVRGNSGIVIV